MSVQGGVSDKEWIDKGKRVELITVYLLKSC